MTFASFQKLDRILSFQSKNSELENFLSKISEKHDFPLYLINLILILIITVACSVFCYIKQYFVIGTILAVISTIVLLVFLYKSRLEKAIPFLCFIFFQITLHLSLFVAKDSKIIDDANSGFYIGYAFALFYSVGLHLFPNIKSKLLFIIATCIGRYLIITPNPGLNVIGVIFFDVIILLLICYNEKSKRKTLIKMFEYKEDLTKLKSLLGVYLPHNLAILSEDLNERLFVNDVFASTFKAESFSQINEIFSSLKVNMLSLDQSRISEHSQLSPSISHVYLSLSQLLAQFRDNPNNIYDKSNISTVVVERPFNQHGIKHSYSVKIFTLKWKRSNAIAVILDDITQKDTIIALKIADENKDKILATISHELRTPINGILGITQIIENEYKDPKLLSYTKTAKVCSSLLLNLINSILDLTQIRNNSIKINPTHFLIDDVLEEVDSIFRPQCIPKSLNFDIVVDNDVPQMIISDRNRLTQILINILSNAIKFTFKGKVTVYVRKIQNEDEIQFAIEDTGIGIKRKAASKLFQMFRRLESDSLSSTHGVGLGLTISNDLVKLLNPMKRDSKIQFTSVHGEGSTFYFIISTNLSIHFDEIQEENEEREKSDEEGCLKTEDDSVWYNHPLPDNKGSIREKRGVSAVPSLIKSNYLSFGRTTIPSQSIRQVPSINIFNETSTRIDEYNNNKIKSNKEEISRSVSFRNLIPVLVVDDNSFNIMVVTSLLRKNGYIVTSAFNGEEAIQKVKEQDRDSFFKLIFMDCQMPVMDGYQCTEILRSMMNRGEVPEVPILALTANNSKQDQAKCFDSGMSGYLVKPLKEEDLQKLINKIIKN